MRNAANNSTAKISGFISGRTQAPFRSVSDVPVLTVALAQDSLSGVR
jgi:hypothetical protein